MRRDPDTRTADVEPREAIDRRSIDGESMRIERLDGGEKTPPDGARIER